MRRAPAAACRSNETPTPSEPAAPAGVAAVVVESGDTEVLEDARGRRDLAPRQERELRDAELVQRVGHASAGSAQSSSIGGATLEELCDEAPQG